MKPSRALERSPSGTTPVSPTRSVRRVLGFAALCIIWGSTWLAIKEGYGGLGALNLASLRFFIAGTIMLALIPLMGARLPKGQPEWLLAVWVS